MTAVKSRIVRQQPQHRRDEKIDALLLADPAEDADAIFARQPGLGEAFGAILRRLVGFEIDAVVDDGRGAFEKRGRDFAGGDDLVHLVDQEPCVAGMPALASRIENDREPPAEPFQHEANQHLDVAPGVPDANLVGLRRLEAQAQEIEPGQAPDPVRRIGAEPDGVELGRDQRRDGAVDRGAARIAQAQIGNDDFDLVQNPVLDKARHSRPHAANSLSAAFAKPLCARGRSRSVAGKFPSRGVKSACKARDSLKFSARRADARKVGSRRTANDSGA